MKKILVVMAHPDDEAFGPGGTIAKYAGQGTIIHLLTATKGEAGQNNIFNNNDQELWQIREKEARQSAEILGIKQVEFLAFKDGELKQNNYHQLAEAIGQKIKSFKPQVLITFENRGVSGHLDHVAVSLTTTYAYQKTKICQKLYYYCLPKFYRQPRHDEYFIYFPLGYKQSQITTIIDYHPFLKQKIKAMQAHQTQKNDVQKIIKGLQNLPKVDSYILQFHQLKKIKLPEKDLFSGIN